MPASYMEFKPSWLDGEIAEAIDRGRDALLAAYFTPPSPPVPLATNFVNAVRSAPIVSKALESTDGVDTWGPILVAFEADVNASIVGTLTAGAAALLVPSPPPPSLPVAASQLRLAVAQAPVEASVNANEFVLSLLNWAVANVQVGDPRVSTPFVVS